MAKKAAKKHTGGAATFRDRIRELRRVPAEQLQADPRNWRTHPPEQQAALRGILGEVGYADAVLARETADGGLVLIDGHLRVANDPAGVIPVLVLDVDEAEAAKLLAVIDPLAAMAGANSGALDALLRDVSSADEALTQMLAALAEEHGITPPDFEPASIDDQGQLDQKSPITCPHCNWEFVPK